MKMLKIKEMPKLIVKKRMHSPFKKLTGEIEIQYSYMEVVTQDTVEIKSEMTVIISLLRAAERNL